jgi:hypothetical protein
MVGRVTHRLCDAFEPSQLLPSWRFEFEERL